MYKRVMKRRSIIEESFSVYKRVHHRPEKPVSLMTRLLNLATSEGRQRVDPFMGSSPIVKLVC